MPFPLPSRLSRYSLGPLLVLLLAGLCLLPFLALCWYAHPSADDFLQATDVYKHGRLGYISHMYLTWTGRYTSILFWAFCNPVVQNGNITGGYGAVCLVLLLFVPLAFYVLLRALLQNQFSRPALWAGSGILTVLLLWQLTSPAEAFYWFVSNYNYMFPGLLTLLWLAALARQAGAQSSSERQKWLAISAALAVLVIGGNETNAVPIAVGVTSFTALLSLQKRRIQWPYVGLSAVVVAACAVAFLAPGNFARMGQHHRFSAWESVAKGGLSAYKHVVNWLGNGVLVALTILLLPVSYRLHRIPGLALNRLAKNPLFITLLMSVSLVMIMWMGWWGTGQPMPLRSRNVLYLFFLVSWFLNAHAWARYAWRHTKQASFSLPRYVQVALLGWVVLAFGLGHTFSVRGPEPTDNLNNILVAYQDLLGGAAARYDAQLTERYQTLRTPNWVPDEAVVEPLQDPPRTILFGDITTDVYDWSNMAYAEYFGKKTIRIN